MRSGTKYTTNALPVFIILWGVSNQNENKNENIHKIAHIKLN